MKMFYTNEMITPDEFIAKIKNPQQWCELLALGPFKHDTHEEFRLQITNDAVRLLSNSAPIHENPMTKLLHALSSCGDIASDHNGDVYRSVVSILRIADAKTYGLLGICGRRVTPIQTALVVAANRHCPGIANDIDMAFQEYTLFLANHWWERFVRWYNEKRH